MATPRDLDPKFRTEKADPVEPETTVEQKDEKKDVPMIVYRQRVILEDGTVGEKNHGPMPVKDWPAYEKEHNL